MDDFLRRRNDAATGRARAPGWWLALALIQVLLALPVDAQETGAAAGVVTSAWNGSALAGATVTVRGTTLAAQTDANGRFELNGLPPGEQVLRISKPGYASVVVPEVRVIPGQVTSVNGNLRPEFHEMEEYEVAAEENPEQSQEILIERQDSSSIVDAIGSERFERLAAGDAAEIMTKITGVSVVEGKYAVIRGLSDRYNIALLNGAEIPSADPYRRAAQLDMFPADVIDNVLVSKTFTPDMPGGFTGGAMDIRTKTFPQKFFFKATFGLGYNTQATGNDDFLTYPGGKRDWTARDDGTRELPSDLKTVTGDDLDALRQTATSGSQNIPLAEKSAAAAEMDQLTRSFGSEEMGPTTGAPNVDFDFNFLVGDTVTIGSVPVGFFVGANYEQDARFYDDGVRNRYRPEGTTPQVYQAYDDARSLTKVQWSTVAGLAAKPFKDHELAYTFLYTQSAEDMARSLHGQIESSGENQFQDERRTHLNTLAWTQRDLMANQFRGLHLFPVASDLQADWLVSLADTSQQEPDLRYFNFISYPNPEDPDSPLRGADLISNNTPIPDKPTRYFRDLNDENILAKFDLSLPLEDGRGLKWLSKAGLFTSRSTRTFTERTFSYAGGSGSLVDPTTFPYEYMSGTNAPPPQLVVQNNRGRYEFSRSLNSVFGNNSYDGNQDIGALYAMLEAPVTEKLSLGGGARYELTDMAVTSTAFGTTNQFTGSLDEGDWLPALNLTWRFRQEMAVRLSYTATIARPTYREFARYRSYDVMGDQIVEGNPYLQMTHVQNVDARWDYYLPNGSLISFGGFYKYLEDPIEKYNATLTPDGEPIWSGSGDFVTFLNTPKATVWGLELEARQNLGILEPNLKPFSLGFNFAWIKSTVQVEDDLQQLKLAATGEAYDTRPLYDQSPYIINADLSYDNTSSGTQVTLSYNFAAQRLSLISNSGWDVYEQPSPTLDLVISQRLGRGFTAKFVARNLLNPDVQNTYNVGGATDTRYVYSSYTKGVTLGISVTYAY
jgi:TonB-dependent receptor